MITVTKEMVLETQRLSWIEQINNANSLLDRVSICEERGITAFEQDQESIRYVQDVLKEFKLLLEQKKLVYVGEVNK